jgi:hypothetical protein
MFISVSTGLMKYECLVDKIYFFSERPTLYVTVRLLLTECETDVFNTNVCMAK